MLDAVNQLGEARLWQDESPIWARIQHTRWLLFPPGYLQVVGHTPVAEALYDERQGSLSLDTFSTRSDGKPIGNERFVVVDSVEGTWQYADAVL